MRQPPVGSHVVTSCACDWTIEADRDMTWVVVNDPIPAGASHLGTGLGRDSQLAVQGEERQARARPAFEERAFDGFRAYYEFVPKGKPDP